MTDPSDHELARISYMEVLDATKHQDDKIGRLLAAVAFLTGGALVFTARDILQATYVLGGREYRLTALFLGSFLVLDLVAVILWILTMATPLTLPGTKAEPSFLFFRVITKMSRNEWKQRWVSTGLGERHKNDLISETYNLARRADGKYVRSGLATRVFLASVILLVPTLVLSIDSVSQPARTRSTSVLDQTPQATSPATPGTQARDKIAPAPWTNARRALVGLPVALVVLALGLWRWWVPVPKRPAAPTGASSTTLLERRLLFLALGQALFVFFAIFGDGGMWGYTLLVLASGATTIRFLVAIAHDAPNAPEDGRSSLWWTVAVAAALAVLGCAAIVVNRPDFQLLVAILAACLVPFESTPVNPPEVAISARSEQ